MNKKEKYIIICIIILAIFLRIFFIYKTNISKYQFDCGIEVIDGKIDYDALYSNYDKGNNEGRHINYIMHFYNNKGLPSKIVGQFYHPPMHHFIMANWLKFMDFFSNNAEFKLESMQFVTLLYSIVILIAFYNILGELNIKFKSRLLALLLFSFYPIFIWESGSINNDELVIMFSALSMLYTIKWKKNQSYLNTIILSLLIGFGMMTKTSMFVMVVPAIFVYFDILIRYTKENKNVKKLILELAIFSLITIPLSLWYHFIMASKNLNTMGIMSPKEELYIGNINFISRFLFVNPFKFSYCNLWNFLQYTSINFGFFENRMIIILANLSTILLIISIYYLFKYFKENLIINITIISFLLSYIILNIKMPYVCSMHARYMVMPIALCIIGLARGFEKENNKLLKYAVISLTMIISIVSTVLFINL